MKTQLCDPTGVQPYNLADEAKAYPSARFLVCRCNSKNPLGILKATDKRILQAISDPRHYDRVLQDLVNVTDILIYLNAVKYTHEIRYVKYLDNAPDRLMVFCFIQF